LLAFALLLALILRFLPDNEWNGPVYALAFVVQLVILLTGAFLYWRGRQYAARAQAKISSAMASPTCCTCERFERTRQPHGRFLLLPDDSNSVELAIAPLVGFELPMASSRSRA
jgi:hypothetical protein